MELLHGGTPLLLALSIQIYFIYCNPGSIKQHPTGLDIQLHFSDLYCLYHILYSCIISLGGVLQKAFSLKVLYSSMSGFVVAWDYLRSVDVFLWRDTYLLLFHSRVERCWYCFVQLCHYGWVEIGVDFYGCSTASRLALITSLLAGYVGTKVSLLISNTSLLSFCCVFLAFLVDIALLATICLYIVHLSP